MRQIAKMYGVEHILRDAPSKPRIVWVDGYPWDEMPWERELREAQERDAQAARERPQTFQRTGAGDQAS